MVGNSHRRFTCVVDGKQQHNEVCGLLWVFFHTTKEDN